MLWMPVTLCFTHFKYVLSREIKIHTSQNVENENIVGHIACRIVT